MITGLKSYGVSAKDRLPLIRYMTEALTSAGCVIEYCSEPDKAPFVLRFRTPKGEAMGVVAYAFLATRTETTNRPKDERSFQIKYGSKLTNEPQKLFVDPNGVYTTLLIGIDLKSGFLVGLDPAIHNPTRFFIRVEFKDEHAEQILSSGWHAWERAKRNRMQSGDPIEVCVGATKQNFLRYVMFERAAAALSPGDRQLLADRPELERAAPALVGETTQIDLLSLHPLLKEFSLDSNELLDVIANARRLKMAVRGWVAERHLFNRVVTIPDVTECAVVDEDGKPDLQLRFRGGRPLTIECKNVLRTVDAQMRPRIDFQRTRASKADPCSRYYSPSDFDIVAGCLHPITAEWEFRFILARSLPSHKRCEGKIESNLRIDGAWYRDASDAFASANTLGKTKP